MIYFTKIDTIIGSLGLVRDEDGLLRVYLPNEDISAQTIQAEFYNENIIEDFKGFAKVIERLDDYFNGKKRNFTIPFKLNVSPFYNKVLVAVHKVKHGRTASYSQIAQRVDNPNAVRAVGTANARNPLPIIIPCHRIIAKNGKLGGYRGGIKMKKHLLEFEKENLGPDLNG